MNKRFLIFVLMCILLTGNVLSDEILPLKSVLSIGAHNGNLQLVGNKLYVCTSSSYDVKVYDLSNIGAPKEVGCIKGEFGITNFFVEGDYFYGINASAKLVSIFNTSDLENIKKVSELKLEEELWDVVKFKNMLYILDQYYWFTGNILSKSFGLCQVDVSILSEPVLIQRHRLTVDSFPDSYYPNFFTLKHLLCYYGSSKSNNTFLMSDMGITKYSFLPKNTQNGRFSGDYFFLLNALDMVVYRFDEPSNFIPRHQFKDFLLSQRSYNFDVWENFLFRVAYNQNDSLQLDVFCSNDNYITLENIYSYKGLPVRSNNIAIDVNNEILVVGFNLANEIYIFKNNLSTNTRVEKSPVFPGETMLYQNFPNPFNATTQIEFTISQTSKVKLIVYDLKGREIQRLVDENKSAGNYSINYNSSNLSSGIYYYKLETDNHLSFKKFILLK